MEPGKEGGTSVCMGCFFCEVRPHAIAGVRSYPPVVGSLAERVPDGVRDIDHAHGGDAKTNTQASFEVFNFAHVPSPIIAHIRPKKSPKNQ
jgi:hypothetical protein